ncbi:MAG TPA: glutamate--cysteine ligase [Acidimicrobiales bacterium]|jgi:carboxylate-amine ligase|nr:glutamate--cysteine ligase [Acidimicrobiales bacterium]
MEIPFNASDRCSLGVELELEIVDRDTRELSSVATELFAELGQDQPDGCHPKVKHELFECTAEVITGICGTVAEARDDLASSIKELSAVTEARGLTLMCSGSHPFSDWHEQVVSPDPRYHTLLEEMQWVAKRLQIFGVHFHVGVRSAEKAIAIANALNTYIPHFLALTASSPYWAGRDTGMASSRSTVFESLPTAGLPYQLSDWKEFEQFMGTLVAAQAITSIREVWWDIRPHPDFGTVELRICDGIPTLGEVSALAALAQSVVEHLDTRIDAGEVLPVPREWIVRQNKWRAARHGLDAEIIVGADGRRVPLRQSVEELVEELSPVAARIGCQDELGYVHAILDHGPSYQRQRRIVDAGGSLVDVVDALVTEFETDTPG